MIKGWRWLDCLRDYELTVAPAHSPHTRERISAMHNPPIVKDYISKSAKSSFQVDRLTDLEDSQG
jgi:hypothetical protein